MTGIGRTLRILHAAGALLMIGAAATGYAAAWGWLGLERHIPYGFLFALGIAFAHAMTLFYFAGLGVSMREAVGRRRDLAGSLQRAERTRRSLALPLGLAIVTLMAAVILGGGSHTRRLPTWVHHAASLLALACNLHAARVSFLAIGRYEALAAGLRERLEGRAGSVEEAAGSR